MAFQITKAVRRRVPLLISMAGVSGSGKTYSSLLLAAGMAGPNGRVGFLDTENGRGAMYADSPGIKSALPSGYEIAEMREPFEPSRYTEAIHAFADAGCHVLVVDSMTHEWEGYGGCGDIAENNKMRGMPNWAKAKIEHKRFMCGLLSSQMDIICCLRAREKIKIIKDERGKDQFVSQGIQAICEKNFIFEMTLSLIIEEGTHKPIVQKCPEPLRPLFSDQSPLVTQAMGARLREWAEGGSKAPAAISVSDLQTQAMHYAQDGLTSYQAFWKGLTNDQRTALKPYHEDNKAMAATADREAETVEP